LFPGAFSVTTAEIGCEVGCEVAATRPGSSLSEAMSVVLAERVEIVFGTGRPALSLPAVAVRGAGASA
jgi:hypothetical protein